MDFFEAQARAKKRTSRLVVLFALAVAGTISAAYLATVLILRQLDERDIVRVKRIGVEAYSSRSASLPLWQPQLFVGVSLATFAIVGIASLVKWSQFSAGGSAVAQSVGGRQIDPQTTNLHERRLLNVVEEMAIASGTPMPAVYILEEETAINAFAAGLTTSDAAVAVTRGTMEKLTRDELQGVIAHEFSHILNGDMRLNMRLTALVFGILVLGIAGRGILWSLRHVGSGRSSRDSKGSGGIVAVMALVGFALLVIGYVGYFFGRLIQAAVSRQREYLADASAVQFTRNPTGITGALKKIGGYALGSRINSTKSEAIGHFFFASAFRSSFGGLWATHPPLDERIRAVEPNFDGKMFAPPEVVDVARESFRDAGLSPGPRHTPDETVRRAFAEKASVAIPHTPAKIPFQPTAAIAAIGTIESQRVDAAQQILGSLPPRLLAAAHEPKAAAVLLCGLLLSADPALRARERNLLGKSLGAEAIATLANLEPDLQRLTTRQKLPTVQIAVGALRQLPPGEIEVLLGALDELVHSDAEVTSFEFALQKFVAHTLKLNRAPKEAGVQFHSFQAVQSEINAVLSVLAHASGTATLPAQEAFAAGAGKLPLLVGKLQLMEAAQADLATLDRALDKLAAASFPIKQRTLLAASYVVGADGQVAENEAELLRAISAALDCPMPPIG